MNLKLSILTSGYTKSKHYSSWFSKPLQSFLVFAFALILGKGIYAQTGTWTEVNTAAPDDNMGVMLLLTDGTVFTHDRSGGGSGTGWDKLTPDNTGSYVNGTWSRTASMNFDRLFFPSQVLPSGKVFVSGGEYGAGGTHGEVYDPVANTWTNTGAVSGNQDVYDGNSEILANGNVLVGLQLGNNPSLDNQFYNPGTNTWSLAPNSPLSHDEAAWLKLPDASILFVGIGSTNTCRYIPSGNNWVTDATVPVQLYDPFGSEAGAAIMLPNGKAIFFGATGHNAIYTPSGNASPGTWAAAADFPSIGANKLGTVDAPAVMMPNGKILCAVSPVGTSHSDEFRAPTYFFEYNYLTNTFAQVTSVIPGLGADSIAGINCDFTCMLLLPDGTVLLGINQSNISQFYWVYTPVGANIAQGKPTINSIYQTACNSPYHVTGKLFNGISEGAAFGDDWQMSTNYPLVRLTNGTNTYYAKTTSWNRVGAVQTDSLEDTAQFTLPPALPAGTYTLVVVANGFPSNPTLFTPYATNGSILSNVSCHGNSNGNAQAIVSGGASPYTYKWSNGATTVSTSVTTGAILSAGTYTLTVTDKNGCTTTAAVIITQPNALTVSTSIVKYISCNGDGNGEIDATPSGGTPPYTYLWSGGGTNSLKIGVTAGTYTVTVTDKNNCTTTASINAPQSPVLVLTKGSNTTWAVSDCNGSAWVTPSGGSPPYKYSWSPGGGTTDTIKSICNGSYCCTVTDKLGCVDSVCINVITGIPVISNASSVKIFPDPNNGIFTVSGLSKGQIVELYNYTGQKISTNTAEEATMQVNISDKADGVYFVRIITKDVKLIYQAKLIKAD